MGICLNMKLLPIAYDSLAIKNLIYDYILGGEETTEFIDVNNGYKYHVSLNKMTYLEGRTYCESLGSSLANKGMRDDESRA